MTDLEVKGRDIISIQTVPPVAYLFNSFFPFIQPVYSLFFSSYLTFLNLNFFSYKMGTIKKMGTVIMLTFKVHCADEIKEYYFFTQQVFGEQIPRARSRYQS
jgi:hypothetical protein